MYIRNFKKTFVHELGHYITNLYFSYNVKSFKIYIHPTRNSIYQGSVSVYDFKEPVNKEERIKLIIISVYGCIFQHVFCHSTQISSCFENEGNRDRRSVLEYLVFHTFPYDRKNLSYEFDKIIEKQIVHLQRINLKDILWDISKKLDSYKINSDEVLLADNLSYYPDCLYIYKKEFDILNEVIDDEYLLDILKEPIDTLYLEIKELYSRYIRKDLDE